MYSTLICGRPSHAYVTTFLTTDGACGRRITTSAATQIVESEHSSAVRQLLFMAHAPPEASSDPSDGPGQLSPGTNATAAGMLSTAPASPLTSSAGVGLLYPVH
jgi:hypothetical protein